MRRCLHSKKADLNMSIQAIVIIVLAMTLLGLGIGFIRGQFSSLTETTGSVQEQIKQQILDDLRTGNKKLSFPASELTMERGDSEVLGVGVKNTGNAAMTFGIEPVCIAETPGAELPGFFYSQGTDAFQLSAADANVYNLRVTAPDKDTGNYLCTITVKTNDGGIYAQKDFFISVVG